MKTEFRFQTLTVVVFCIYLFWGSFGVDITLHPATERMPLHRGYLIITAFILLFNIRQVLDVCVKNKVLIALVLYVLLTSAWSYNPTETLKNFVFLLSVMFISMMTALAFSEKKAILVRWLFWLFLLMVLASIITALKYPNIGINATDFGKPRWIGITTHPNSLGAQALSLIWLSSNLFFLSKSKIEKAIILASIVAALYAIVKADSMTSLVASLVTICYVCYCYLSSKLNMPIKIVLYTTVILSFLIVFTVYMGLNELATSTFESTGRNTTFTGRSLLWQTGLKYIADNFIFGFGFDNLEQLTRKSHMEMSHLHNGYIEILVKGGLIATTLLTFILLKTYFHQLRIKSIFLRDFIFLNTGLIMILLHNMTESSILRGLNPLSIFIIFIIVATSIIPISSRDKSG